jgi:hypothetical protein
MIKILSFGKELQKKLYGTENTNNPAPIAPTDGSSRRASHRHVRSNRRRWTPIFRRATGNRQAATVWRPGSSFRYPIPPRASHRPGPAGPRHQRHTAGDWPRSRRLDK